MDGKTEFCPVATKNGGKKIQPSTTNAGTVQQRRHGNHNHPLPNCRRTTLVRHTWETNAPFLSLGYIPLFISICKHRHERTRGPRTGGCCWYGGSSMLRSRLASSSPPHSAGTGRSEHHSSPCTRGKPAPGKHPATSTTRSPGQLAQPRPSPCEVPMPDQTQDRGGGGITRTKVDR